MDDRPSRAGNGARRQNPAYRPTHPPNSPGLYRQVSAMPRNCPVPGRGGAQDGLQVWVTRGG